MPSNASHIGELNLTKSERPHISSLDGLRAIAIFAVLAVHAGVPGAEAGWLGVDLFFVLSGFLITSLICRECDLTAKFNFRTFWIRRALRIFPPYYLYVMLVTIAALSGMGRLTSHYGHTPQLYIASLWLYFINYIPQGGIWTYQMLTLHLWSLAVEEQFYLLWPLLFVVFKKKAWMLLVSFLLTIIVIAIRLTTNLPIQSLLYTRGLPIFFGCTAALIISCYKFRATSLLTIICLAISAILTLLIAILIAFKKINEEQAHHYIVPFACMSYSFMISCMWTCTSNPATYLLGIKPLVFIGRISYGIYLYHMAVHQFVWSILLKSIDHWPSVIKFPLRFGVFVFITILISTLSYKYLEKPFLAMKDSFRSSV